MDPDVAAGQAVYTKSTLAIYDVFVLGFSNAFVWRCPTRRILALYDRHVSDTHLEVGVGTGFYLDRCRFPTRSPRLTLLDLNQACLDAAARRVRRYQPQTVRADVLQAIPLEGDSFQSIGLTYVLHCLPGTMETKAVCFDNLARLLRPGGILFGATLLSRGVRRSAAARRLAATYNRRKIFSNDADDLPGLRRALERAFRDSATEVVGSAALFWGRR
jgi:ubiquinone/menaquinone biosynthesis C-methylase UbiE